ncbi:hypothetical protein GWI33_015680, partial [Rhynchophorus ferrugineus]
ENGNPDIQWSDTVLREQRQRVKLIVRALRGLG